MPGMYDQGPRQMGGQQGMGGGMGAPRQMGGQPGGGGGGMGGQGGGQAGQIMGAVFRPQGSQRPTYGLGDAPGWSSQMWSAQARCQRGDGNACHELERMKMGLEQEQQKYGQDYSYAKRNAIGQANPNGMMRQR